MAESRRKGIKLVIVLCVMVTLAVAGILIWTARRATVRFYSEQGNIDSISVALGETIEQPKDPTPIDSGYAFGGWYSDSTYTTEFDFDLPIQKDTTIYVKWVEKVFTVTVLRASSTGNFTEVLWSASGKYKSTVTLPTKDTSTTYQDLTTPKYNFQRANQTFVGFATKANTSGDFGYQYLPGADFTIPNSSISLYAIFRGEEKSFIFNPNSGNGEAQEKTGYFNEYFTVPTSAGLSKPYYKFAYWCKNPDGIPRDADGNICDMSSSDCVNIYYPGQVFKVTNKEPMTLYAIWERNTVNISIDAVGGSPSTGMYRDNLVDAGLEGGYSLSQIEAPTKNGYRLIEYNTMESGQGVSYSIDATIEVGESDITLYAIWARLLTVSYSINNRNLSEDDLHKAGGYEDFVGIEGESFTIPGLPDSCFLNNFAFLGWSLDENASSAQFLINDTFTLLESDFVGTDHLTLYAIWKGNARTLKLKNTSTNESQEVSSFYGRKEQLKAVAKHEDPGYYFVGWGTKDNYDYKNPDIYGGVIYELGEFYEVGTNQEPGQSANDILYSLWCPYTYDVNYYLMGGELAVAPGEDVYQKQYVYNETVSLLYQAVKEGYRFLGWAENANSQECIYDSEKGFTLTMPSRSFNLYAVWVREVSIRFDPNIEDGYTGYVANIDKVAIGEKYTIPSEETSNGLKRTNYKVVGWSTKPDGGTVYAFGEEVTLTQVDQNVLYAIWQGDARYVEVYDGSTLIATIQGEYGKNIELVLDKSLNNTDPGYEVGGFVAELEQKIDGAVQIKSYDFKYGDIITTTGFYFQDKDSKAVDTLEVKVKWNAKSFTVAYELNGGIYNNDENNDMSGLKIYAQYKSTVTLAPETPEKAKYIFQGWTENVNDASSPKYLAGAEYTIPARNVTLYAVWARVYTVSYDSNGGELNPGVVDLETKSYAKGSPVLVENVPYSKSNYTFDSWNTRADGKGTSHDPDTYFTINEDTTLYAVWLGRPVTLTLLAVDPDNVDYNKQVSIAPNPRYGDIVNISSYATTISAPEGLQLKGWKKEQPNRLDEAVDYTNDYQVDDTGDIVLYSVWAPKSYYFIIGLNGGTYNNTYSDYSASTPYRTQIDLADFTTGERTISREGYKLLGFADQATAVTATYGLTDKINMPAATKRIYCIWQELTIITFDKNCDDAKLSNQVFEGIVGDADKGKVDLASMNAKFTRDNFTLQGWSTSSTATVADAGFSADNLEYRIQDTNDIYLYAVWTGRAIKVIFDNNVEGGGNTNQFARDKKYGDVIDLTANEFYPSNTDPGYVFSGWSLTKGQNVGTSVGNTFTVSTAKSEDASVTLYAVWAKKYFTLTYDYGDPTLGGKANPDGFDSRNVQYTSTVDVSEFSKYAKRRVGYEFKGWAMDKGEASADRIYGVPENPEDLTNNNFTNVTFAMPNDNITLYALWEPIYVSIIYKTSSPAGAGNYTWVGSNGAESHTVQHLYQYVFTLPSNTIEAGVSVHISSYRFVGWTIEGGDPTKIYHAGESFQVNVKGYITFIAQWEENVISVVVNANGGIIKAENSSTATYSVRENATFTFLTTSQIERTGYRLVSYTIRDQVYDISTISSVQITIALMTAEDIVANTNTVRITANWIKQVKVSFNINAKVGDVTSGTVADMVFDSGNSITLPNCNAATGYQREHYKFKGWNEYSDGSGTILSAGSTYNASADTILYAVWEGESRIVKLVYNTNAKGTNIDQGVEEITITSLKYGSLLDTSLYGGVANEATTYKLDGWTTVEYIEGQTQTYTAIYQQSEKIEIKGLDEITPICLYAVWTARSYHVVYNANGGVFHDGVTTKEGADVQVGGAVTVPTALTGNYNVKNPSTTKTFYTFAGWSTDKNFDWNNAENSRPSAYEALSDNYAYIAEAANNINSFVMPNRDVTLYAIWAPVTIQILYYREATDTNATWTDNVKYNETISLRSDIRLENHSFKEWVHVDTDGVTEIARYREGISLKIYNSMMSENEQLMATKRIILVADWIPQTVYVQLFTNNGKFLDDGTDSRLIETSVGRKFKMPEVMDENNRIVWANYALTSFNLKPNGSQASFAPGEEIDVPVLSDNRLTIETIVIDGESVDTYILKLYAQWVQAEAYIARGSNADEYPYYQTLKEAVDASDNGDTIKLLRNCYVKSKITINKNITLEPYDVSENLDLGIYRYIRPSAQSQDPTYTGVLIEIGLDGSLTVGNDSDDTLSYSITFGQEKYSTTVYDSVFKVKGDIYLYNGVVVAYGYAQNGGAIYMDNENTIAQLHYVKFIQNTATENGGAICAAIGSVEIEKCEFVENKAKLGGAVYSNSSVSIENSSFTRNSSTESGGAVYNGVSGVIEDTANTYSSNSTVMNGGAIYNAGNYDLSSAVLTANKSTINGGAIYNEATASSSITMTITNCVFGSDSNEDLANNATSRGGAIENAGKLSITGSSFYGNKVNQNSRGGAISNNGSNSSLIITTSLFQGNRAPNGYGGAIENTAGTLALGSSDDPDSKNIFRNNTVTTGRGHSVSLTGGTVNIYVSDFVEHVCEEQTSQGGVIYQNGGSLTFYGGDINNNTITHGYGGVLIAGGTCIIYDVVIYDNTAKCGAGIAITNGSLEIYGGDIYKNTAGQGGGIYVGTQASVNLRGGSIGFDEENNDEANIANRNLAVGYNYDETVLDANGGGIYTAGNTTIIGGTVINNKADANGGGIYNNGILTLTAGVIKGNIAVHNGGGVYGDSTGGLTRGNIVFNTTQFVSMSIEDNLCANGAYRNANYDDSNGEYYGNGIYTSTKTIISGYIKLTSNGKTGEDEIVNDLFISVRENQTKPTKIAVFDKDKSHQLSEYTQICITSKLAQMGDKLVEFPSREAAAQYAKHFSYGKDDSGFRVKENYLILGNYAAIISRDEEDQYYQSLVEAYLDAEEGEEIVLHKNINMQSDLQIYNEEETWRSAQEALVGGYASDITTSFYIGKAITIVAAAEYKITRGGLEGDLFTVVGEEGQLTLGKANPSYGSHVILEGDTVETGSLVKVVADSNDDEDVPKFILNKGATLTNNNSAVGGAIYADAYIQLLGGTISNNKATQMGGAIYSTKYTEISGEVVITGNEAPYGGAIYIGDEYTDTEVYGLIISSFASKITENIATISGGGVYVNSGKIKLTACDISGNNATNSEGGGGGIYLAPGTILETAYKTANDAKNAANILISNNYTVGIGGGVAVDNATFRFKIGTIKGNRATTSGGGIALINTTEDNDTGLLEIYNFNKLSNANEYNNIITENWSNQGGGIAVYAGIMNMSYTKLEKNTATIGAGIYNQGLINFGKFTFIGSAGKGNVAQLNGGGIYNNNGGTITQVEGNGDAEKNLTIAYNEATTGNGGGIANSGTLTFKHRTDILNNRAGAGGGIANLDDGVFNIEAAGAISKNTAISVAYGGGGLYNVGITNVLASYSFGGDNSTDGGNTAYRGGGIYNSGRLIFGSDTALKNITINIDGNTGTLFGGGVFMVNGDWIDYSIGNTYIRENIQKERTGGGGGIAISGGTVITKYHNHGDVHDGEENTDCWMYVSKNATEGAGGGIFISDTSVSGVTLNCVQITENNAKIRGGGLALQSGDVRLANPEAGQTYTVLFKNNTSPIGAGMYLNTVLYVNCDQSITDLAGAWADEIYLANPRSYFIYYSADENHSFGPKTTLKIAANEYLSGRRIAKFATYQKYLTTEGVNGEPIDIPYVVTFAEDYYEKFTSKNTSIGIGYEESGYVTFIAPVAYNINKNIYYGDLADAAANADNNDSILILESHTVRKQVLIADKNLTFVINKPIELTRSQNLYEDMFRVFTTYTQGKNSSYYSSSYTVKFNPTTTLTSTVYGTVEYGKDEQGNRVALTIDGNKDYPTLQQQTLTKHQTTDGSYISYQMRGSLIGVNSGPYKMVSGKSVPVFKNAGDVFGHTTFSEDDNVYLNGYQITGEMQADNYNIYPARASLEVYYTNFKDNFSAYAGGAITFKTSTGNLILNNCNFEGNETGFYSWQTGPSDAPNSITDRGAMGSFYQSGAGGGAIFMLSGSASITSCAFRDNISASHGGAISAVLVRGFSIISAEGGIASVFENNQALYGSGGAIDIVAANVSSISIHLTEFIDNKASHNGGAISMFRTSKTYQDLINEGYVVGGGHELYSRGTYEIENNLYGNNVSVWKTNGAVESSLSNNYAFNIGAACSFVGNIATKSGGAIYARHYLTINDNNIKFENNVSGADGGAIWTEYRPVINSESLQILNNKASGSGGGIYFANTPTGYVENITVSGNEAGVNGGGIYFTTKAYVKNVKVENNSATNGGGICFTYNLQNVVIGGEINNNFAAENGGGIYAPKGGEDVALTIGNVISIDGNKAAYAGGGVYCFGSIIVIGADGSGTSISNNEIYGCYEPRTQSTEDNPLRPQDPAGGGGGGLWSWWEVMITGKVSFLNNKITSPNKLTNGGGAAIFLYLDELWLSTTSRDSYTGEQLIENAHNYVFFYSQQTYSRGTVNQLHSSNDYYNEETDSYEKYPTIDGYQHTRWRASNSYGSSYIYKVADITISGNDAGKSLGDGIYYWGSNIYMSGNLKIDDDVFMLYNSAAKLVVDNTIMPQQNPINFTYEPNPSSATETDGQTFISVAPYVAFNNESMSVFNLTNPGYTVELTSGKYKDDPGKSGLIIFEIFFKSQSVVFEALDGENFYVKGASVTQHSTSVGYGESMIKAYRTLNPSKPGHRFIGFKIVTIKTEGSKKVEDQILYEMKFDDDGGYGKFPTLAELEELFPKTQGSDESNIPTQITIACMWEASSYDIYVHKYVVDTGTVSGGKSITENQYEPTADNGYKYTIASNEKFENIIAKLSSEVSTEDSSKTKDYLAGNTIVGYMLSFDRKYYTAEDMYPYTFGYNETSGKPTTDLYIVYKTAEYTLNFTKDDGSTWRTNKTTMTVKHGQYVTLLTNNAISKPGYKLIGWRDVNETDPDKIYNLPTENLSGNNGKYTITNNSTYQWSIMGDGFVSPSNVHDIESYLYVTALESMTFEFKYEVSSESPYDYLRIRYKKSGSWRNIDTISGERGPLNFSVKLEPNDQVEFLYRKDSSVHSGDDCAKITGISAQQFATVHAFESDMTFEPVWEPIAYNARVYYNYPDGSTGFKLVAIPTGTKLTNVLNSDTIPNPMGYTLSGFSTSVDGTTGLIMNETMPGEEFVLYAQWEPIEYEIYYYAEDGGTVLHKEMVTFGQEFQVWKSDAVVMWLHVGTDALYDPLSSFTLTGTDLYSRSFKAYTPKNNNN